MLDRHLSVHRLRTFQELEPVHGWVRGPLIYKQLRCKGKPSMLAMQASSEMNPLSESERKAMSAWLQRGRHSKRGDRAAYADRAQLRRRTLLQGPPQPQGSQPSTGGPPDQDSAQLVYTGPVNALAVTYRVASITQPVGFGLAPK